MATHVLIWAIVGVVTAVVGAAMHHRRAPRDWALAIGMGVTAALVGGLVGRSVQVSAHPVSSSSMGALAAAVLALSVYYVVIAPKAGGPKLPRGGEGRYPKG